jgi:hypothetical protein
VKVGRGVVGKRADAALRHAVGCVLTRRGLVVLPAPGFHRGLDRACDERRILIDPERYSGRGELCTRKATTSPACELASGHNAGMICDEQDVIVPVVRSVMTITCTNCCWKFATLGPVKSIANQRPARGA